MSDKPAEFCSSVKDLMWSMLLMFGCFCVGFNMAIAFHEAGHALAMVMDGVPIREFHLNPFSWSWTFPEYLNHPLFTAFGGVTLGLVLAMIPATLSIWIRSAYFRPPALVTAVLACWINGVYLIAGTLYRVGDGGELIGYGVPPVVVLSLGCVYLAAALVLFATIQPALGIRKDMPVLKRTSVVAAGIVPYVVTIIVYNLFLNREELLLWLSFSVTGVPLIVLLVIVGSLSAKGHRGPREINKLNAGWGPVVTALILGFVVIIGELVFFGVKENPF